MAYDKVVDSAQLDANLTAVADAIRTKGGTDAQLAFPSGFVSAVQAIEVGSSEVTHLTFTPTENSQHIEIPFAGIIETGVVTAYCANIQGESDVSRIKQFFSKKFALDTTFAGRIDVVNADGTADYWTSAGITMNKTTIRLATGRLCYFAAGETYVIQITEVAM